MNLVTGANGLVGSHVLVELANRNQSAVALLRNPASLESIEDLFKFYFPENFKEKLSLIRPQVGDITDVPSLEDAFIGVEAVYHTAAVVSFRRKDRNLMRKVNVEGTSNVVNVALTSGVKKLAFVSSTAALGRSKTGEWVTEETKWKNSNKNSHYAITKFCAEREIWRGTEEGLPAAIINPSVILGPGDYTRSSGKLFSTIEKGMKFYTEGVNGYVDVRDVAFALVELTEKEVYNERFILAAENKSYLEVFTAIANALDKNPPTIKAGSTMLRIAVWGEWLKSLLSGAEPTVTKETARNALNSTFYDSSKIKARLGLEFHSIEKAVKHTAGHFKR